MQQEETIVSDEIRAEIESMFVQLVVFEIDKQLLGIEVSKVREVVKFSQLTLTPGASDLIEGIIELREGIIPVIDLRDVILLCDLQGRQSPLLFGGI